MPESVFQIASDRPCVVRRDLKLHAARIRKHPLKKPEKCRRNVFSAIFRFQIQLLNPDTPPAAACQEKSFSDLKRLKNLSSLRCGCGRISLFRVIARSAATRQSVLFPRRSRGLPHRRARRFAMTHHGTRIAGTARVVYARFLLDSLGRE